MNKKLKIGLFGFGVVGQGLYNILRATPSFDAEIIKIAVKDRSKQRSIPVEHFTYDKQDIFSDPEINVVVELINDPAEAYHIVKQALTSGRHVVTANKKMLAEHLEELYSLQLLHGVSLLYEASACGSIPVIRNLEEYYDNELLHSLEGIFNGSSNYILSRVTGSGLDYATALGQAQEAGFAESDPVLDVEGFDAKNKLCILALHAYGKFIDPSVILNIGITSLNSFDVKVARQRSCRIKLLCQALKTPEGKLHLYVIPAFVQADHYLYHVNDEYNGVITSAGFADTQFFSGKGAGGFPTGAAVLSDLSALQYGYRYSYKKLLAADLLTVANDLELEVYLRGKREQDLTPVLSDITEHFLSGEWQYLIGYISLKDLIHRKEELLNGDTCIIATGNIRPEGTGHHKLYSSFNN